MLTNMKQDTPPYPQALAEHLSAILLGVRAIVQPHTVISGPLQPLITLIWFYLHRPVRRLERLIARWQQGRLAPPRARIRPVAAALPPRAPRLRLPTRHAWLIRLFQRTAQFNPHLEILANRPEMAALLAAAPQAGRILRPLFRMLGIRPLPANLRLPPRPRPPRPVKPKPAVQRITARERRALLSYSPGRIRVSPNLPNPLRRKRSPP